MKIKKLKIEGLDAQGDVVEEEIDYATYNIFEKARMWLRNKFIKWPVVRRVK
jgi:hypothetical protein